MTTTSEDSHPPIPALLTTGELAERLGCSGRHICRMRKRGLPTVHIGALVRFDDAEVRQWLDAQGTDPARRAANQASGQ